MSKSVSSQWAKEIRAAGDHIKTPVSNLVFDTVERSFDVAETAITHAGEVVGAVLSETDRLLQKLAHGLDADKH